MSLVTSLQERAVAAVVRMRERVVDGVRRLRDAAVQQFVRLVTWVRGLPRRIIGALGNAGRMLWDVGRSIISGLAGGIKSLAMAPVDAVRDAGSAVLDGAKRLFGMSSPSTVFRQYGEWLNEGLADGIVASAGGVARAFKSTAADLADVARFEMIEPSFAGLDKLNDGSSWSPDMSGAYHPAVSGPSTVQVLLRDKVVAEANRRGNAWYDARNIK